MSTHPITAGHRYEKIDPVVAVPVLDRLVLSALVEAGARDCEIAARQPMKMRKIAAGTEHDAEVDWFIGELREANRRRRRLRQEFDRAGPLTEALASRAVLRVK